MVRADHLVYHDLLGIQCASSGSLTAGQPFHLVVAAQAAPAAFCHGQGQQL